MKRILSYSPLLSTQPDVPAIYYALIFHLKNLLILSRRSITTWNLSPH